MAKKTATAKRKRTPRKNAKGRTPKKKPAAAALSPAQKRKLSHLAEIEQQNAAVSQAARELAEAKAESRERQKEYDGAVGELRRLISAGPDPQEKLDFDGTGGDGSPASATEGAGPEWKGRPVSELGLTAALLAALEKLGIETLGQLKGYWDAGKKLTDEKGWGPEKNAKVADHWAEYSKDHLEVYSDHDLPAEELAADDDPQAVDPDDEGAAS